jgi:ABC-2 type transport system permease protein
MFVGGGPPGGQPLPVAHIIHFMRTFFILLGREIKAYFYSPVGYVVMFCFLFLAGYNFYGTVIEVSHGTGDVTVIEVFFNTFIFWLITILGFPVITMRLFAEEYKMGTIESLMTAPVHDWQVVFSKYFGAVIFYMVLWMPSALYFPIFEWVTKSPAALSAGTYFGSYFLLLLIGMFYLSIGCLASVVTRNQIVAAILGLVGILLQFIFSVYALMQPNVTPFFRDLVAYFSTIEHMSGFSSGMIDTRPIVYYLSMTTFMLFLTYQIFQARKWRM